VTVNDCHALNSMNVTYLLGRDCCYHIRTARFIGSFMELIFAH